MKHTILVLALILISSFAFSQDEEPLNAENVEFEEIRPDIQEVIEGNPRDLLELRAAANEMSKAKNVPLVTIPAAGSETVRIALISGEAMPEVFGMMFNPTSVEFIDVTGEPWPIREFKGYNADFLTVEKAKGTEGHVLFVSPQKPYGEAVVAVLLDGLPTAVNFVVRADNRNYHRVKKVQVMRLGDNAKLTKANVQIAEQAGQHTDEDLLSASYGVRPNGFKSLDTKNSEIVAWSDDETVIIFTSLNQILPEPIAIAASQNPGWRAYKLPITSRLTMSNEVGAVIDVQLTRAMDFDNLTKSSKRMKYVASDKANEDSGQSTRLLESMNGNK